MHSSQTLSLKRNWTFKFVACGVSVINLWQHACLQSASSWSLNYFFFSGISAALREGKSREHKHIQETQEKITEPLMQYKTIDCKGLAQAKYTPYSLVNKNELLFPTVICLSCTLFTTLNLSYLLSKSGEIKRTQ